MEKRTRLYVDADACPVKKEIVAITDPFGIDPIFVASYASFVNEQQSTWVFVDQEKDSADLYIINHVDPGDVVITQDFGLASLVTGRGVFVLTVRGILIDENSIPELLNRRFLSYKSLAAGRKIKGPKPFTDEDRKKFSDALTKLLCRLGH
ncbi:hypothetical protein EWI07_10795 [Sporolactobacillus sp. THM7-4]|nr:hypothetical protein EWI07_10795 [Sporolactobacillus sp. THM7-4]